MSAVYAYCWLESHIEVSRLRHQNGAAQGETGPSLREMPNGGSRSPVFAYSNELDKWLSRGDPRHSRHRSQSDLIKQSAGIRANVGRELETLHKNMTAVRKGLTDMPKIGDVGFQFLMTDLSVGLSFARAATTNRSPDAKKRKIRIARRAYEVTNKIMPRARLDDHQRQEFGAKAQELKRALEQLGEVF
jgi:hypothetical protein